MVSKVHDMNIAAVKTIDLKSKKIKAAEKYCVRKEVEKKTRYDKEVYLDQVARVHLHEAS